MGKKQVFIYSITALAFFTSCASSKYFDRSSSWVDIVVTEDVTYYVDTLSIHREGNFIVAREKKLFEPASRQQYVDHIKAQWKKVGNPKKADAWSNFSYSIYTKEYDCVNRRSRIIAVEDYDSQGMRIEKTKTNKEKLKWVDADLETIKDYALFFVYDYDN